MNRFLKISLPAIVLLISILAPAADCPLGDLDDDCKVGFSDVELMADSWLDANCLLLDCSADLDEIPGVNFGDFALMAQNWLEDYTRVIRIHWFDHASFKIQHLDSVIYIDPRNLSISPHDATLILVTHAHGDHYSSGNIANVKGPSAELIAPADVIASEGWGRAMVPGQTIDLGDLRVIGVPAYNISAAYHPRSNNWLGFILELGPWRIYNAGDTDMTDEMKALSDIDVAILPIGDKYTMDPIEAAQATAFISPALALPAHRRSADPQIFADNAHCDVIIMNPGETIVFGP